jgi:hydroxymethylpyrimidine pyrophosphatase-like HAD family hydrolase
MDGTILEKGRLIQPALVAQLKRAAQNGVRVTSCTGRPIEFQRQIFPENGLGVPHALVADERELFLLEGGDYVPLEPWNGNVRERWKTLHPPAMEWLRRAEREAKSRGWDAFPHESEERMYQRGLPTLAVQDADKAAEIRQWLAGQLSESGDALVANRNGRLVQLHDAATGKGLVLLELARVWGIQPAEVVAAGDSANDFSMLDGRHGFNALCPANADDGIKEAVRTAGGYVASERIGLGVLEGLTYFGV